MAEGIFAAFNLAGTAAIVTGAGSGIGEETAVTLAAAGASVLVADINVEAAIRVAGRISEAGGRAVPVYVDVSDQSSVSAVVDQAMEHFGRLDAMVNNAGIMIERDLLDVTPEEFDKVIGVNTNSILYGCQAAARVMAPGSAIVNMLSAVIDRPSAGRGSYAASKGASHQLTRAFAVELGERGIRVNGVSPGWVVTGITRRHLNDANGDIDQEKSAKVIGAKQSGSPLGLIGEPRDIALAVLYLVSPAGRTYTGQVLRPNGGTTMA